MSLSSLSPKSIRPSWRLVLPVVGLLVSAACEVTSSSSNNTPEGTEGTDAPEGTDALEGTDAPISEVCITDGVGVAGAAQGRRSGSLSGIQCSTYTCMCTGLFDSGSGSSWRAWWEADFPADADVPDSASFADVLRTTCYPADDECSMQLEFGQNNFYANTDVRFADGSLSDADRASTYVSMTSVACSGDSFECVGELAGGGAAVWDVGVAPR